MAMIYLLKVIKDLNPNKAYGWDEISIRMIKLCGNILVTPLLIIFENSPRNRKIIPNLGSVAT